MRFLFFALLIVCTTVTSAQSTKVEVQTNNIQMIKGPDGKSYPIRKLSRGKLEAAIYRRTGGKVIRPGSIKGRFVYANCQKVAPKVWLEENIQEFRTLTNYAIDVEDATFDFSAPKLVGDATLFVINDSKMPTLISVPEDKWAVVNVAPLMRGAGEKEAFFHSRVLKELTRGFCILAGAQDSNYPGSLLGTVFKPEDLDLHGDTKIPVDIIDRLKKYPAGFGVFPAEETTYRKACQEGWAPAPTNDVQKVIWDKVHAIPQKPLKIEYNEKRDKGK